MKQPIADLPAEDVPTRTRTRDSLPGQGHRGYTEQTSDLQIQRGDALPATQSLHLVLLLISCFQYIYSVIDYLPLPEAFCCSQLHGVICC